MDQQNDTLFSLVKKGGLFRTFLEGWECLICGIFVSLEDLHAWHLL